ncbi:hypothetical protein CRG98_015681 [Punica granatum]|uniref:Uncharacterized protein n=1 Tax=Punica granatum TaxID=22663 RepID=A0A2I0K6X1_PUNGR|nr:hypothetical protein CRG98_015681 [Punica granatum]
MHVRGARCTGARGQARGAHGGSAGARERARWGVWRTAVSPGMRLRVRRRVYCSPESTSFARNHLNDLK